MEKEYSQLTTSSANLSNRLKVNSATQKIDFSGWLFSVLPKFKTTSNILDLGCGTGKQTEYFLKNLSDKGSVKAIDASQESLNKIPHDERLEKFAIDFDDFSEIEKTLGNGKFDLINSTYAIYYSKDPMSLISFLKSNYLSESGKFVIAGPTWEHELFTEITENFGENLTVKKTIDFMESELRPMVRNSQEIFAFNYLINLTEFNSVDEALLFMKNTTYGSQIDDKNLRKFFQTRNSLKFRKSSVVITF
jgi:SAM-dependent methyltransferase